MKIWKLIGKHQGPLGTTIIYGAEGCAYEIQSRKRHIPHANGSGTWDHTSYFVIQNGQEVKELHPLPGRQRGADGQTGHGVCGVAGEGGLNGQR